MIDFDEFLELMVDMGAACDADKEQELIDAFNVCFNHITTYFTSLITGEIFNFGGL